MERNQAVKRKLENLPLQQNHFRFNRVFPEFTIQILSRRGTARAGVEPAWITDGIKINLVSFRQVRVPSELSRQFQDGQRPGGFVPVNSRKKPNADRVPATVRPVKNEALQFRLLERERDARKKVR